MIASQSPSDPNKRPAAAATAAGAGGAAATEEGPWPSSSSSSSAVAGGGGEGGTSRTPSTATASTAQTAVSAVTLAAAADDASGMAPAATNDGGDEKDDAASGPSSSTSTTTSTRRHQGPPRRSYASLASDTSFVLQHNDDDNDEGEQEGDSHPNTANATTAKTDPRPIERIRHRFASHQTNHDHDGSEIGVDSHRSTNVGGRPPPRSTHGLLLAPLRRHFASHAEDPTTTSGILRSHVHAQPTPSPATQAALTDLIASKRLSLRPAELAFLEEVNRYGGEDDVQCALERLEDDGLFFVDCGGGKGGGDVGDEGDFEDRYGEDKGGVEEEEAVGKASPNRRMGLVREEKKLDGDDDGGTATEELVETRDRQLQEPTCSILLAKDENEDVGTCPTTEDANGDDGATANDHNAKAFASKPIELQASASMYEPRAVHSNSLDPSDSDLSVRLRTKIRSSSDGVATGEENANDDDDDDDEDKNRVAAMKKAKARKRWTKVGSAARMAALAHRRAQHQHRTSARSISVPAAGIGVGSLPSQGTAKAPGAGSIVDAVPGQGETSSTGLANSRQTSITSTSTSTSNIASIWRAHETGLSVTSRSSERRIDQKRRSMLQLAGVPNVGSSTILTAPPIPTVRRLVSGGAGGTGSSRRAAYRHAVGGDSFLSVGSLGDVLVNSAGEVLGPTTHNAEDEDQVFRRHDEDVIFRSDGKDNRKADDKLEESDEELFEDEMEEDTAGLNTSTASAPVPESPTSKIARPAGIGASDGEGGMNRRSISVGSVRSVKFAGGHTLHEFSEDDMQFNKIEIPGDRPPPSRLPGRPPTILRRSSSLNRLPPSARRQVAVEMSRARLLSADVTPVSSPSANSIPSIRHAHPIRSDSAISLGSVLSAAPSLNLHRANPLRSDSFLSVNSAISAAPSLNLHRANPIRSNSVLSMSSAAPSLNLHRANPVRSQSFLSEIGDVGLQRNISVADSVLTFDDSPITSPRASMSADDPEDEAIAAAKAAAAAAADKNSRPVMMRMASKNNYDGEGFEIADMVEDAPTSPAKSAMLKLDSIDNARKYRSLLSEASESMLTVDQSFKAMPIDDFVRSSMFRRTLSDDGMYGDNDSNGDLFDFANENDDWDLESEPEIQDAWNVLQDEYAVGYSSIPFLILGTSADDVDCHPHVLSPPLMESLQPFFPYAVSEDNFYLKFSLVRDGASLHTLLQNVRGAKHTIVAIETVEGEVFGAFCSSAWRKNWNYFGSGEAFLWRMRRGRDTHCPSIIDQAQMESELDVFPWTGKNNFVQLCTSNKIAIGGGTKDDEKNNSEGEGGDAKMNLAEGEQKTSWDMEGSPPFGFGLAIEDNLLHGMSSPCLTFNSPPLSKKHNDGSPFEILNLEVWTLTPCNTVEEAEKLELSRLFLEGHRATSM